MNVRETAFSLAPGVAPRDVLAAVAARFPCRRRTEGPVRETWYDTFDGRVRRAGGTLRTYRVGEATRLSWKPENGAAPREAVTDAEPAFARGLPDGPLREQLAPVIAMRRLLPYLETERREVVLDVLDADRKTVARMALEELRARASCGCAWTPAPPVLRAVPLRGYEDAFEALRGFLEEQPGLAPDPRDRPDRGLAAAGLEPARDRGKLDVRLDPGMRADAGVRRIHRALLDAILRNEEGVRADLDSEFLHDYRVAVRRTRTVLGQVQGVFPERPVARFRRDFQWLAQATGPTRDMDVFLLRLDDYERELGDADLSRLRALLERRQRREHARLARTLATSRYRRLIDGWRAFLDEEAPAASTEAPRAAEPVRDVLSRRIWKLFRRMASADAARAPDAPAAELHRLRLLGKKLRYLLDVSRSLYEDEPVALAVRELKRLQDVLGDFNDYEVQRGELRESADALAAGPRPDADTLLAMGRVSERLRLRGEEARARFARRFERFASRANRDRYRALFGPAGKAGR